MSKIMSLEGPRLHPFSRMHAGINDIVYAKSAIPAVFKTTSSTGTKLFIGALGAIFGGWLVGTPSGQGFIRRIRGKSLGGLRGPAGDLEARIHDAIYKSKDPAKLRAAVADANRHVSAMKRAARRAPKHPGSSYYVDSRGNYDPQMYSLVNTLVDARKRVQRMKRSR